LGSCFGLHNLKRGHQPGPRLGRRRRWPNFSTNLAKDWTRAPGGARGAKERSPMDEMAAGPCGSARSGVVLGVLAAAPALFLLRGFTVDDALIPARYAAHLAQGLGYRFNAQGPSTDGVTP